VLVMDGGGGDAITCRTLATSDTFAQIGPTLSWVLEIGITENSGDECEGTLCDPDNLPPSRLTNSTVGLRPTTPHMALGQEILP